MPPDEEAPEPLDTARLGSCLAALPERERAVLVMTFYDDRPADAVAAELGLSAGNVGSSATAASSGCAAAWTPREQRHDARLVHDVEPQELLEYWLGELDEAHESRLDEHLFACSACSERLRTIVDLGAAIRREFAARQLRASCCPPPFIAQDEGRGPARARVHASTPAAA